MMPVKKGFTLIELVIVIIILGILAAIILPKFVNFKTRAIDRSEDAIAGNLNSAVKTFQMSYIVAGGDPSSYPIINPFSLLVQSPPFMDWVDGSPDGLHWRVYNDNPWYTTWYILCPHYDGTGPATSANHGRRYLYWYAVEGVWGNHKIGDFWFQADYYH